MKMAKQLIATTAASLLALSPLAMSYEAGEIVLRAGATTVSPDASSGNVAFNGTDIPGTGVDVDDSTQLGLTLEYLFTKNIGLELLAATPFEHDAEGTGGLSGVNVLSAKQLPPTLSVIYHFDNFGQFEPYVGAGLNYTIFFDEEADDDIGDADVSLDNSFGLSFQIGADYHLGDKWLLNASVRYIDISTTAEIRDDFGDELSVDVDIDPFVYTISAGYRF